MCVRQAEKIAYGSGMLDKVLCTECADVYEDVMECGEDVSVASAEVSESDNAAAQAGADGTITYHIT